MSGPHGLASRVLELCVARGVMVTTAESCTGGLVAGALTDLPGSSAALDRGFVAYSNAAKSQLLGVPPELITRFGAVSAAVAEAMAAGALARSDAGIAVSVTGIAGPGGGTRNKPVGLVWFGVASRTAPARAVRRLWSGEERHAVRTAAVAEALGLLVEELSTSQAAAIA